MTYLKGILNAGIATVLSVQGGVRGDTAEMQIGSGRRIGSGSVARLVNGKLRSRASTESGTLEGLVTASVLGTSVSGSPDVLHGISRASGRGTLTPAPHKALIVSLWEAESHAVATTDQMRQVEEEARIGTVGGCEGILGADREREDRGPLRTDETRRAMTEDGNGGART